MKCFETAFVFFVCAVVHAGVCAQSNAIDDDLAPLLEEGVARLLDLQEGDGTKKAPPDQWPYEGVYRVRGEIPIGYRVGGTAIVAEAMLLAPGFADDAQRREAVQRGTTFILASIEHPLMQFDEIRATYDVRGWGYAYALLHLLRLNAMDLVPAEAKPAHENAIRFFIDGIEATSIPESGGWNYSRPSGFAGSDPPAPFMTGPTLQALFMAKERGYAVDDAIIASGLDSLERARTQIGSIVYAGTHGGHSQESVPGAVGRMLVTETTLYLGDRGGVDRVRSALDAFFMHHEWLLKRKSQQGTHVAPYGIAPYYFYYAHRYAAQAIEILPEPHRAEYRRRLRELLLTLREEDGSWNDRVFPRSANYGTAMVMLALLEPESPQPARWRAKKTAAREPR